MKYLNAALLVFAFFCGLLTQADAAITAKEGPAVVRIGSMAALCCVASLVVSPFLRDKSAGRLAVANRSLFLLGCVAP
jgi:hypothetical protein